ncbi:MAG: DUF5518 domain-containing protein [Halobacterium sp.]
MADSDPETPGPESDPSSTSAHATASASSDASPTGPGRSSLLLSKPVDWLVAALLVVPSLGFLAGGVALYTGADRREIAELVAEGTIESTFLTDAELVDVSYSMATWGGIGLAVTGLLVAGVGVAYLAHRSRNRTGAGRPDTLTVAVLGAVVTSVVSFVPFSPVVGGGVAGYLAGETAAAGARLGAVSGLLLAVPLTVLFAFLTVGVLDAGVVFLAGVLLVAFAVSALFVVALSALGGYLGVYVAAELRD